MLQGQAEEDQSEEMEISESDSSGCDEEVQMWRRYGRRKGQKKARVDRAAMISDSGWGQGSQSVNQYSSQSVNQSASGEQREEVQMEVESGGDSGAVGSSGQSGIDGAEWRGDMVGGGSYVEEDDELMLEYMGNEGVGSEEIDRFMGWTTVDVGGRREVEKCEADEQRGSMEERSSGAWECWSKGSRQRRGNYVTSTLGRGIRRNSQVEVEGQIRIDGEDGSGEVRGQGGEGVRSGDGGLWAIAGTARRRRARLIRMVTPGGRHRGVVGTLFCSVDARSSTEDSVHHFVCF